MFCRKCGIELKEGARFCTKCGAPVVPLNQGVKPEIKTTVASEVKPETEPDITLSTEPEVKSEVKPETRKPSKNQKVNKMPDKKSARDDNNRMLTIIMIIVLVVAILVASAAAIYLLKPEWIGLGDSEETTQVTDETEEGEEEEGEDGEGEEPEDGTDTTAAETTPVPEAPAVEEEPEPEEEEIVFEDWDLDIESECRDVKSMSDDYENNLGNYKKYTLEDGNIIAYVQNGEPVKIIVKKGYKGWNYSREYYGVEPYYTRIFDDMGTRELYYSGSRLCRLIDENGIAHDYNTENWAEYNELGEKAAKDKMEIKQFIKDNI